MGYHLCRIPKGTFGEFSKIEEEFAELVDAHDQDNKIMVLVELSDMIGAIKGFLTKYAPGVTIKDLIKMSEATERAFLDGSRK
jgi:phosphoribosyl-ATP pyrophosphohydrolase